VAGSILLDLRRLALAPSRPSAFALGMGLHAPKPPLAEPEKPDYHGRD